ncbi:MAG: hypothetical protein FJY66_01140 [Calditrichaeota bacterium]|nr:hypothetical protein [Calditrichota bacterium]
MKALSFVTLLICFSAAQLFAQPNPDTLWTRTYGGSYREWAKSVQQTADGGYVVAGQTTSFGAGNSDFYLAKTNSSGDTLWTRTYGGSYWDEACSVQQTADSGYIVAGWTESFGAGSSDFYLVKTNSQGDTLWTRTYGGNNGDWANSVQQTADGGYVVAGYTSSFGAGSHDFYLVRMNSLGDTLWTRTYGGSSWEQAFSVRQTSDSGYIIAGTTYSFGAGEIDFYLVKTNSSSDTLWTRTYGGSSTDYAYSVQQTADGGYIVAGRTGSFGAGSQDLYLVKTNSGGDALWTRAYGGSNWDEGYSVQQTADGGYIVAGWTQSFGAGYADFYLVKISSQGDTLWTRTYGGSNSDRAHSVQQTADGGYIVAGWTQSFGAGSYDFYLVKTGPEHYILVRSPNGGEEWRILQHDTVRWISYGFGGGVKVELNRNYPSGAWEILVDSTEDDGEEAVWVTDPPSVHCRVKVSALQDSLFDISDADFSIVCSQGYLALVRPSQPTVPVFSWNAGIVECPDSVSETFRLKNFGDEAIVVFQPLEPASADFSRTTTCPGSFVLAPGEMSTCEVTLTFDPLADGICPDTLLVQSDAMNQQGGYVRFPLSGQQISTPDSPQVVIITEGIDARLRWYPITQSIGDCSVSITAYLVFYRPTMSEPYYYHGYTTDTTYVHAGVVQFAGGMFYEVVAYVGPLALLMEIPPDATREEVLGVLGR